MVHAFFFCFVFLNNEMANFRFTAGTWLMPTQYSTSQVLGYNIGQSFLLT